MCGAIPTACDDCGKWYRIEKLCNCEEGDPGAFNDKGILESDPFTLIEGLIIMVLG